MGSMVSKWSKTKALLRDKEISKNVPVTEWYSKSTLRTMLERHNMVYVKPDTGTGGSDVIRVEKSDGRYKYQLNTSTSTFKSFSGLSNSIDKITNSRPFIVQQGIHLLKYNDRSFDLRVMVQKNPKGTWETTGVIGRLGHSRKIVTNVCRGGASKPIELLLGKHVTTLNQYKRSLRSLGERTARHLCGTYKKLTEIGMDVGIDQEQKAWILEVNTRPAIYGFKSLDDRSVYQKIIQYQKAYAKGTR